MSVLPVVSVDTLLGHRLLGHVQRGAFAVRVVAAVALSSLYMTPVQATTSTSKPANTSLSGPLVHNTKVDLELRNFYINKAYRTEQYVNPANPALGRNPKTKEAWSQGALFNVTSGYFADLIGFDLSLFGAAKLWGDEEKFGSQALRNRTPYLKGDKYVAKQVSYSKIGQAYLKTKFGNDDLNGGLKSGAMRINTPLLNAAWTRVTPSTHEAIYGDIAYKDKIKAYGIFSNRVSTKTDNRYEKYTNDSGQSWNVGILGASYDSGDGLTLALAGGRAKEYMTQYYANGAYTLPLQKNSKLLFEGYYYHGKEDGKKYGTPHYESKLWNLVGQLSIGDFSGALSYQAVIGDAYDVAWSGNDSTTYYSWNSVIHLDFNRKNEKSWQGKLNYDFHRFGLTGLSATAAYVSGEYRDNGHNRREWERDIQLAYNFKRFGLEGLSLTWINATVRTGRNVTAGNGESINENRLIVDYTFHLI